MDSTSLSKVSCGNLIYHGGLCGMCGLICPHKPLGTIKFAICNHQAYCSLALFSSPGTNALGEVLSYPRRRHRRRRRCRRRQFQVKVFVLLI